MSFYNNICEAVARNCREFGFPQATAENIFTDPLYRAFAISNLEGWVPGAKQLFEPRAQVIADLKKRDSEAATAGKDGGK